MRSIRARRSRQAICAGRNGRPDSLSPNFITDRGNSSALNDTLGETVRAHVDIGEPITRAKLVQPAGGRVHGGDVGAGHARHLTKIDEQSAAGGFILPGDRVDVVMTHRTQSRSGAAGYESQTILTDVKVLAIGQTFEDSNNHKFATGKTATLELSQPEAELLALAGAMGNLTLSLRSAANGSISRRRSSPNTAHSAAGTAAPTARSELCATRMQRA